MLQAGTGATSPARRQHCVAAALEEAKAVCVERGAAAEGFVSNEHTVEISGVCPNCREA